MMTAEELKVAGEQLDAVAQAMAVTVNDLMWLVERLQAVILRLPALPVVPDALPPADDLGVTP